MKVFDPQPSTQGNALFTALAPLAGPRSRRALAGYAVGSAAHEVAKMAWNAIRERIQYVVTIHGDDPVYGDVHTWMLDRLPDQQQRSLDVRTQIERSGGSGPMPVGGGPVDRPREADLQLFYDGSRTQAVRLAGHKVQVSVKGAEIAPGTRLPLGLTDSPKYLQHAETVVFTAYSLGGRDAVLALLAELAERRAREDRPPTFYMAARWGGWDSQTEVARRQLNTVVLRDGQLEGLVADIADFLSVEADYARLGVPYHRGYLFHGPPGTGKTSVARALATHFDLDVYFLALSDLEADTSVLQTVAQVQPRSMLVIEDVDVVHAAQERTTQDDDEGGKKMSLSGLLNALDGIATPHGLITVMTTNRLDVLDDALVRPGRIDRVEEIGYLDSVQLRALVRIFLGLSSDCDIPEGLDISPAQVVEIVKRNLRDPEAALLAIKSELLVPISL